MATDLAALTEQQRLDYYHQLDAVQHQVVRELNNRGKCPHLKTTSGVVDCHYKKICLTCGWMFAQ